MLQPVSMARFGVLAPGNRVTTLTRVLARSGVVQVEPPSPALNLPTAMIRPLAARYEALENSLDELARHLELKLVAERSPFEVDVEPGGEIDELERRVNEIIGQVDHIQSQLVPLAEQRRKLSFQVEELLLLSPVNWKLEDLRGMEHLSVHIGVLRDVNIRRVEAALGALPHVLVRLPGPATGWDLVLVFCQKASHEQVRRTLAGANFKPVDIPEELTGLPAEAEARLWEKQREMRAQREELTERLRGTISAETGEIRALWEKARAARLVLSTQQSFGRTTKIVYVNGWVPKKDVPKLRGEMERALGTSAYVEVRDPIPGDPPIPVELKNPSVFRPFEEVVTTYGLPNAHEIDPTVVVAITYLLMFGTMFGDVGQGLLLALAGFWAAKKWPSLKRIGQSEPTRASPLQARAYAEALVDTPPVLVSSPAPEYPTRLRRLRIEGDVLVSLLVSADGQVAQVVPLRGRTELRQAAAEGIRRWRYEPARLNGAAVPCWTTASIAFRVP